MTVPEEHLEQTNETFRAIGRYVYCFSRLIFWMRAEIEDSVGNQHLAQILCGDMAADQIQRVFFGVCSERYQHSDVDQKIAGAIRKRVKAAIEFRNSISHGDWLVGVHDGEGTSYPALLNRVRPGRSGNQWTGVELTPAEIDAKSDELESLRHDVYFYGNTAGGRMSLAWEGRPAIKPSDVFVLRDGIAVREGAVTFTGHIA